MVNQRRLFADTLFELMKKNKDIVLITGDLGYKVFDQIRDELPHQFHNVGAAEQFMLDFATGLAYSGKIPVCYSITPFLLYRPFETIRTYMNHEKLPIALIGSGRDKDYIHDGISHWAHDDKPLLKTFKNIHQVWPDSDDEIIRAMSLIGKPCYINLKR